MPTAEPSSPLRAPASVPILSYGAPAAPISDRSGSSSTATPVKRLQPLSLAMMLDVGLPDGAVLGVAYRPAFWARLQAGAGTNAISPGMRAGAVIVPFSEGPSLTIEGGYYFEGDANAVVGQMAGSGYSANKAAQRVGYQFANLHVGMDFGSRYTTFFLHGGMTYLHTTLHDANDLLGGQTTASDGSVTTFRFNQDLNLNAFFPSFKLGFLVYLV